MADVRKSHETVGSKPRPPRVLHASRLVGPGAYPKPTCSTDGLGCLGISAAVYQIAGSGTTPTFAFPDITVGFLHGGSVGAEFDRGALSYAFGPGGLGILPARMPIALSYSDFDCTTIRLMPDVLAPAELNLRDDMILKPQLNPSDIQLTMMVACLRDELEAGFPNGRLFVEQIGAAILTHVIARYGGGGPCGSIARGGLTPLQLRQVKQAMRAGDQNLSLTDVAQQIGFSYSHFSRAFRHSTGQSPYQWYQRQRIERARKLMTEKRSLTSIAAELGYSSLSHFSATFKQIMGISPQLYRRSVLK